MEFFYWLDSKSDYASSQNKFHTVVRYFMYQENGRNCDTLLWWSNFWIIKLVSGKVDKVDWPEHYALTLKASKAEPSSFHQTNTQELVATILKKKRTVTKHLQEYLQLEESLFLWELHIYKKIDDLQRGNGIWKWIDPLKRSYCD